VLARDGKVTEDVERHALATPATMNTAAAIAMLCTQGALAAFAIVQRSMLPVNFPYQMAALGPVKVVCFAA